MMEQLDRSTRAVAELFARHPYVWVSYRDLADVGGFGGWRTRVSNARRQLGWRIDNKWHEVKREDGTKYRVSFYRYVPDDQQGAA